MSDLGLDVWIYCTLHIHTVRDYRQYSAVADSQTTDFTVTYALGFSVFTSRIMATDLQPFNCNLKSHMESSFQNLIPFLPLLSTQFNSPALNLTLRQAGVSKFDFPLHYTLRPTVHSASLFWNQAHIWALRPDLYYCQTVAGLLMWGALSDERTGLSCATLSQQ
jgi:hypothetical protein